MTYRRFTTQWMGWVLAAVFVLGSAFYLEWGRAADGPRESSPPRESVTPSSPAVSPQGRELLNQFSNAFSVAAAKVNPSVVPVFSEQVRSIQDPFGSDQSPLRDFFGDDFFKRFFRGSRGDQREVVRGLGSGVIVTDDGYILTNNHVVDGAEKVTVMVNDKKKYEAKVVGRDKQTDLAVIKIDAKGLPAATLGNSDTVRIGQWVIAVGNPFQLMHTVTAGIISATGRSSVNLADYEDFIQTDASINPGNSGGALADLNGNVVGINTAIVSSGGGNVGIGFAVPINMAKTVMSQLIAGGKVTRGYLGLVPQDVDEALGKALKLNDTQGALVADVSPDGPADKAGVKRGDLIERFNNVTVENSVQLRTLVAGSVPGSKATLGIRRDGKDRTVTVILGERPTDLASKGNTGSEGNADESKKFGLSVEPLKPELAQQFGYKGESGVVVADVTPAGPADEAGLQRGDLIKEVDQRKVSTQQEFWKALAGAKKGSSVALLVRRGEMNFFVGLETA